MRSWARRCWRVSLITGGVGDDDGFSLRSSIAFFRAAARARARSERAMALSSSALIMLNASMAPVSELVGFSPARKLSTSLIASAAESGAKERAAPIRVLISAYTFLDTASVVIFMWCLISAKIKPESAL